MKKSIFNLLFTLVITVMIICSNATLTLADGKDKINFKVDAGFDSQYKIGNIVPVSIEIQNNLKNINGELQLEVESSNNNITNNVIIYSQKINLPVNSTKQLKMNVPIIKYITKINLNIVEGKKTVFTKEIAFPGGGNSSNYYIGILSDDYGSLSYIDKIPTIQNANISCKNIKMDIASFPEDEDVLKNFNAIVINNIDTSKFTKDQYAALKKWVYNGGVLLIGTGPSYKKTLSIFQDDFLKGKVGEVSTINTNKLEQLVGDNKSDPMKLDILDVKVQGAEANINDNETIISQKISRNKGAISVASFDLGLEPIHSWFLKEDFGQKLISLAMPSNFNYTALMNGMINQDTSAISSALNNIPELPLPKTSSFAIIFVIYILLVGLISYIVLKKIDKREFMWITVPIISIVFAVIMYFSGISTRMTKPVANVLSLVNIDSSSSITTNTYAGILTPKNSDLKVEAGAGMNIKPIILGNYENYGSTTQNNKNKHVDAKVMQDGKTSIEFYKSGIFATKAVSLQSSSAASGKLECKINFTNGKYTGTVMNGMGYDLNDCYILTPTNYINLGTIKKGETKQISIVGDSYNGQIYDFISKAYAAYSYSVSSSGTKISSTNITNQQQFRINQQRSNILNRIYQNSASKVSDTNFIGWGSGSDAKDIIVNGEKVKKYEKSLITSPVSMTFINGNAVEYPFGYIKPTVNANSTFTSGKYNYQSGYIFGTGNYEITFKVDGNINISSFSLKYANRGSSSGLKVYIWDKSINKYVEGNYSPCSFDGDNLKKYIDNNMIKLKFEVNDQNTNFEIPNISVKGVLK